MEYNSFRWHAIRLFNQLPLFVRNTTVCSIHIFKKQLDSYLSTVPDSLCQPGSNNSQDHGDCLRWWTPRDCSQTTQSKYSERIGRSCIVSHVTFGRLKSLAYNSVRWRAIRLFNAILKYIRCISSCSVVSFKSKLDCYLKNIVNLPDRTGFSNSLDSGDILQWWTPCDEG